jgi:hypothetical protein
VGTDLLALGLAEASDTGVVEVSGGAVARSGAILREAGWFSDLVDDVFAPGGLWT